MIYHSCWIFNIFIYVLFTCKPKTLHVHTWSCVTEMFLINNNKESFIYKISTNHAVPQSDVLHLDRDSSPMDRTHIDVWTRNDSDASCKARIAVLWKRMVGSMCWATSFTKRWKESFWIKSSVDFWYFRISRKATVPGRKRRGFLTCPVTGSVIFRPFIVLYLSRGHFPPVLLPEHPDLIKQDFAWRSKKKKRCHDFRKVNYMIFEPIVPVTTHTPGYKGYIIILSKHVTPGGCDVSPGG